MLQTSSKQYNSFPLSIQKLFSGMESGFFFFNFCKCLFCCSPFTIIILSYCRLIISNNGLQADQCISTFFFNCPDDYLITQLFSQWSELNCQKSGNIGTYNSQCQVSSDAFILFIVVCRFITLI